MKTKIKKQIEYWGEDRIFVNTSTEVFYVVTNSCYIRKNGVWELGICFRPLDNQEDKGVEMIEYCTEPDEFFDILITYKKYKNGNV